MKDRDINESQDSVIEDEVSSKELRELVEVARQEAPGKDLGNRILETLSYRRSLVATLPATPWSGRRRAAMAALALALAAAAAVGLWLHFEQRKHSAQIVPEPLPAGQKVPAVASQAPKSPPPDPCAHRWIAAGREPLIDDFEDGDDEVLPLEGRVGQWRWVRDTDAPGTAPALLPIPRPGARPRNRMAIHVKGGRLQDWGAIVEFNFRPSCYDASAYRGLSFQAKGPGRIFVAPREVDTIPVAEGGTCVKSDKECYNPHVKKIELTSDWETVRVAFSEVEQRGYGRPPFDPHKLHSIAFLIRAEDTPYDLWLDDISFEKP